MSLPSALGPSDSGCDTFQNLMDAIALPLGDYSAVNKSLRSVVVRRFKGIQEAPFDASAINVFIGANNSGKSSLAQMLHFGIGLLQAIELAQRWGNKESVSVSLSPTQLLYSPCVNLYALGYGGQLIEDPDHAIEFEFVLQDGAEVQIAIRKGRNGNIYVTVENVLVARTLASLQLPFTIYSPGLAGIARHENYISNGVLLRTIARGDANLVFRNILLRLSGNENPQPWQDFLDDLTKVFPETEITVDYRRETDEFVNVMVTSSAGTVPVELAGTGVLQAVQILSYVHYFHPSVIILDEPDSHLHPNNQRLLCKLLQGVAEERDTQVFLTTHSRHVVDALSGQAAFLWVRNGTVERMEKDYDLAVLLDIGALDVKEMLSQSRAKCIVLTEDSIKRPLEVLLDSSGFPMHDTLVLAYYGCTSPHNLRPLLELIRASNRNAKIVVHRDRDYLTERDAADWETQIRSMAAEPFLTDGVDIESHYLDANHLSELNGIAVDQMATLLQEATTTTRDVSIEKYVNGRTDLEKKKGTFGKLNVGLLATEAPKMVDAAPERYRYAKAVLKELRRKHQDHNHSNLRVIEASRFLKSDVLCKIARKL